MKETYNTIKEEFNNTCACKIYPSNLPENENKYFIMKHLFSRKEMLTYNDYRIKIDTGFACNANCFFCYYKSHLKDPFLNLNVIKEQLFWAKKMNFSQVEFSGGESTYHPEWFSMLEIATKLNLKSSLVSNGLLLADEDFCRKSKEAGLHEVLLSVHSYKENHDKLVKVPGAYDKILKAIENCIKNNILVRINITVSQMNIKVIEKGVKELITRYGSSSPNEKKGIVQFNFIEINNSHEASKTAMKQHNFLYNNSDHYLSNILDYIITSYKNYDHRFLNLRYFPYCTLPEKYHNYIMNYYHHWFDKWDWNPLFVHKEDIFNLENRKTHFTKNKKKMKEQLKATRLFWYYKTEKCLTCKYNLNGECDGFKKQC